MSGWGDGFTGRGRSFLVGAVVALLLGNAVALAAHDDDRTRTAAATDEVDEEMLAAVEALTQQRLPQGSGAATGPTTRGATAPSIAPKPSSGKGGPTAENVPTSSTTIDLSTISFTTSTTAPPYTYEVALTPTCAAAGEDLTVTFRVEPGSSVAMVARYVDRQTYLWGTTAGADGIVVHTWKPSPAPGPGRVLTGARTPDGRSGGNRLDFRIVEVPGTC